MNIQETSKLLTQIQIIDNRQIGDVTVLEWHQLVGGLDFAASSEAVRIHFRESTAYLTPAHVRANVERIMLAGLGAREDEYGNEIEADGPALAAWQRIQQQKGIGS